MRELEETPEDELATFSADFMQNGDEHEPDSLAVMQGSLDRHLKNNGKLQFKYFRGSNICPVHLFLVAISLIGNRTTCSSNLEIIG